MINNMMKILLFSLILVCTGYLSTIQSDEISNISFTAKIYTNELEKSSEPNYFEVYDVTADFKSQFESKRDYFQMMKSKSQKGIQLYIEQHSIPFIYQKARDIDGMTDVQFHSIPGHIYLIIQKHPDVVLAARAQYEERADPILFETSKDYKFNESQTFISKVARSFRVPYFFKYGVVQSGKEIPLMGVEFVFYKFNFGKKIYLTNNNSWHQIRNVLQSTDVQIVKSKENGLVVLPNLSLSPGQYYFEEIHSIAGYSISKHAQKISVVIPSFNNNQLPNIVLDGNPLEKITAGSLSTDALKSAQPRILNYSIHLTSNNRKLIPLLPETGVAMTSISIVGIIAIALATYFSVKNKIKRESKL